MPPANYDLSAYGQEHFGAAQLGDKRRTGSLVDLANRLAKHPAGSLPNKLKDPNALRRLYDLMNTPHVTHTTVLQPHIQRTAQHLLTHQGVALCLHDTTELDFTSHKVLHSELGQIGDGDGRGYECHQCLVVLPHDRRVLGLLHQQLHLRADVPEGETAAQRRLRETRESLLWPQGAAAVQEALQQAGRDLRQEHLRDRLQLVDVADRGADTFEFLDAEHARGRWYVIRSQHNRAIRLVDSAGGASRRLHDHLRTLPEQGRRTITVHGHNGEAPRQAKVVISWSLVVVQPPKQASGFSRGQPLTMWAVRVGEPKPPKNVEAVEWFLLTNVEVSTVEQAWERVDWYCLRWILEEYHKAQKTGCEIEGPQFETAQAMQPMIALLSVVAISLLNLRDMSRDPQLQNLPAHEVVSAEEVEVLSGWRYGQRRALTVREYFLALARLGGHQNRRKDHPPGWIVLWRGWQALQLMVAGAKATQTPRASPAGSRQEKLDPSDQIED
jgi:hypothetical protein